MNEFATVIGESCPVILKCSTKLSPIATKIQRQQQSKQKQNSHILSDWDISYENDTSPNNKTENEYFYCIPDVMHVFCCSCSGCD